MLQNAGKIDLEETINQLPTLMSKETLDMLQLQVKQVFIKDSILDQLIRFINWTRNEESFYF
jgi:hypothetical protein